MAPSVSFSSFFLIGGLSFFHEGIDNIGDVVYTVYS